jgi:hypothetical protein
MNCAARTTLSPSVGAKHLYLAYVRLCLEPHIPFRGRIRPEQFHRDHTYPELGCADLMVLGRILGEIESEYLRSGFRVIEGVERGLM